MSHPLTDRLNKHDFVVGVVGAGTMGRGIAQASAMAGFKTLVYDVQQESLQQAQVSLAKILNRLVEKEKITAEKKHQALNNIEFTDHLNSFHNCQLVIEAIIENMAIKTQLFQQLDSIVHENCILATNTSSLSVTELAANTKIPGRVAGLHFFNPVPLMKVAEVIAGPVTDPKVIPLLKTWVEKIGHQPAVAIDSPGFIVNHAGRGYGSEAFRLLTEKIASAEDIDQTLKSTGHFPMGPFALADLVGLDISQKVMESIYHQYYEEPRYKPSPIGKTRVAAGLLGRKTGQGFYSYNEPQVEKSNPALEIAITKSIWISDQNPQARDVIAKLVKKDIIFETNERPSSQALCLVTPLGNDTTTEAQRQNLDPSRTFGVDLFADFDNHVTLMPTPLCAKEDCAQLMSLFTDSEQQVAIIDDSPGFIAQRVIANVVNVGCDIVQQEITSPQELDQAVERGLGYKLGPLALGDKYGAKTILTILNELYEFYRDPRYRPSPWLKRRATLEMSLTQVACYKGETNG